MAYAYHEKIARINLTTGTVTVEHLDPEVAKKFIGGRGNFQQLLQKISGIGSDLTFFGSQGAPTIRIAEIAVSGK